MSTSSSPRTISLHERYAVARRCVNAPSIVSAAAILQLTPKRNAQHNVEQAFTALRSHFAHRIDQVLTQYPLLSYCVEAPRSKAPRWSPIHPAPTSKDILHIGPTISTQATADASTLLSRAILAEQIALPDSTQLDKGPLWKVQLSQIKDQDGKPKSCLVVLATDHAINDGRGMLNLFQMLLRNEPVDGTSDAVQTIPPASDRIFNFKPSTTYMLGVVWQELILPKLPLGKKLKAKLRGPVSWPASSATHASSSDIVRQPKSCTPTLDIIFISAPHLITNIKKLAQMHIDPTSPTKQAATLHAIIHTLALAALYAAIAHSHHLRTSSALSRFQLVLSSCTPISLREESRPTKRRRGLTLSPAVESSATPLPATTGNFVSSYTDDFRVRGNETFWRLANRFAADLASPRGRKLAKQHIGLLAYIPDFDTSNQRKRVEDEEEVEKPLGWDGSYANGWEKFFGDKASGSTPFDAALSVSNLGLIDLPSTIQEQWKVEHATWAQSHTPQGEAFGIDLVGFAVDQQQTLSVAVSSRPDAFADEELHDRFRTFLERLILAFAKDPSGKLSQESQDEQQQLLDLNTDPSFGSLAQFLISSP
ncbi:uncharacterized protein SPSC_00159 [Sporisorium scitamineum]|uniref:Uncharacterized protein n=1 Tax=Sporisorium scitamineum TaxID=49012 RepID=A0A0F7SD14_9BASI|nr:uncharacterized protein SPSC_00159 [Sporisorium scitamineum]CDW99310.1 hypothetical protein [Sporisorium scitamineum]